MKFNRYVWELYKTSEFGKKKIEECKPFQEVLRWNDLENPDALHKISKLIGKGAKD